MRAIAFGEIFCDRHPVIGMIHLKPLPGSPGWSGSLDDVFEAARKDSAAMIAEGVDGLLVENYGDVPFHAGAVPPATIAAMAVLLQRLRTSVPGARSSELPWGVNVLRNDASAALAVAAAAGARFIRVNVHCGVTVTDQGLIAGQADDTLRLRAAIAPAVFILADVSVKHGRPLRDQPLEDEVADLIERGLADGLLMTGPRTGRPPDLADLRRARATSNGRPVLAASGVTPENVRDILPLSDGVIVGTSLKETGRAAAPVDRQRVRRLLEAVREARKRIALGASLQNEPNGRDPEIAARGAATGPATSSARAATGEPPAAGTPAAEEA